MLGAATTQAVEAAADLRKRRREDWIFTMVLRKGKQAGLKRLGSQSYSKSELAAAFGA
jgi:hypothetical protein